MAEHPNSSGFRLPDLGEGLTEAEIIAWHVGEGERVVADQPLVTVETDKAMVDIPAPYAGEVQALHAQVGERLEVGALLVTFAGAESIPSDSGAVVGELPVAAPQPKPHGHDPSTSPKARQRARELGVDLASVNPTGPNQSIGVADVERAARAGDEQTLGGVRRAMAERMADAHARVARASVTGEADITAWSSEDKPMLRLIRAIGVGCLATPIVNARFDDRAFTLTQQTKVDLGIAMETADGLFVPVLTDVNALAREQIEVGLERLQRAVSERSISPQALRGQTITLSNFGAVGGLHAEMMVVPPQVAIVGAGRAFARLEQRILPLSVTFDHRVITGVEACQFLLALAQDLELTH